MKDKILESLIDKYKERADKFNLNKTIIGIKGQLMLLCPYCVLLWITLD